MTAFIDIVGSSGSSYRFRAVAPDALPQAAGNFILVRQEDGRPKIVCSGAANRLAEAERVWRETAKAHDAQAMFIYLNTTRRAREAVHADVVAASQPPVVAAHLD
jgi:hypothetical protein